MITNPGYHDNTLYDFNMSLSIQFVFPVCKHKKYTTKRTSVVSHESPPDRTYMHGELIQ